ncbi:hypothetical protein HF086_015107 [Spodoptera exigua]|uniref:Uncharacterized protein n=1 Tax=Spodoptera exigua TaxID=7107 RepID=A0A922SKQ1_SPOEX|nr:hypothetical protein HF086_015107 [Spodoptera exigua]
MHSGKVHLNPLKDLFNNVLNPRSPPTKASMGHVCRPRLRHAATSRDDVNAFLEVVAVEEATKQINLRNCEAILQT